MELDNKMFGQDSHELSKLLYISVLSFHVISLSRSSNICIIITGSPYIMQSRRESRSKQSSILSIFLVIAYAPVKAIDDNLLRSTMAATVAASSSQLRERRNPNYARACTLLYTVHCEILAK